MADSAREYSDAQLNDMYDYLSDIFGQAEKDLQRKFQKYLADFARLEAQKREKLEAGEITQDEFDTWRRNKLLYGTHWTKLIKQVQDEMTKCNQTALDYINGKVPQIYAINYNHLAEVIPDSPVGGYTFELVNADTVRNIATSDKIMLPPPRKELNIPKDQLWNAKLVNAQLLQGILQGESVPKMAARMANVCNSNKVAATRTARTMTTAAENGGRQSSINRATADGIILVKEWLATNDERTRDTHVAVNHERVRCDATTEKIKKFSNGLAYPGDPNGKPAEVYNCRCTLITKYAGVDRKLLEKAIYKQEEMQKAVEKVIENSDNNNKAENVAKLIKDSTVEFIKDTFGVEIDESEMAAMLDLLKNNPLELAMFEKYAQEYTWVHDPHGVTMMRLIKWHLNSDGRALFHTLFHEFGHGIDRFYDVSDVNMNELDILIKHKMATKTNRRVSSSDEFLAAMRKDKENAIKFIYDNLDENKTAIREKYITDAGVQDFISGILGYDKKVRGMLYWAHDEKYYNRRYNSVSKPFGITVKSMKEAYKEIGIEVKNAKELKKLMRDYETASELWANLNAAYANGGKTLEDMKKACPNSYDAFVKLIERDAEHE